MIYRIALGDRTPSLSIFITCTFPPIRKQKFFYLLPSVRELISVGVETFPVRGRTCSIWKVSRIFVKDQNISFQMYLTLRPNKNRLIPTICQRLCARFRGSAGYKSFRGIPDVSLAVLFGLEKGEKSAYYFCDCFYSEIPLYTIKILHIYCKLFSHKISLCCPKYWKFWHLWKEEKDNHKTLWTGNVVTKSFLKILIFQHM